MDENNLMTAQEVFNFIEKLLDEIEAKDAEIAKLHVDLNRAKNKIDRLTDKRESIIVINQRERSELLSFLSRENDKEANENE